MSESWFVEQQDGTVTGPFHERQISADLISGKISADLRVRQGESGPWCPGRRVRNIFRELAETGWYVQTDEQQYGPFTSDRLLALHRTGDLDAKAQFRQGLRGEWKPAENILSLWQVTACIATHDTNVNLPKAADNVGRMKWSIEPFRHYYLPFEKACKSAVDSCIPNELLRLRNPTTDGVENRISVVRSNDQLVGLLSGPNSQQLIANSRRGIAHVALFALIGTAAEVAIILCPPGTHSSDCRTYIEANFTPLTS